MSTITLTREQVYERVWTEPMTTVAAELGISSVALKKTCKKLNIPTPMRGYWAKMAVGLELPKEPLPPQAENTSTVFDVEANKQRREEIQQERASIPADGPPTLNLPVGCAKLHPVTMDLHRVLKSAKPNYEGLIHEHDSRLPSVAISPANIERVVRALSALCIEMENRGIPFTGGPSKKDAAFRKGDDAVGIAVQETIEVSERQPTAEEKRRPSWEWQTKIRRPSGRLRFMLRSNGYIPGKADWREGPRNQLEIILHMVAEQISAFFPAQDERRKRDAECQKRREEEEKVRRERERLAAHNQKLADAAAQRAINLVRAAEWWRLHLNTSEFVTECEKRWSEQPDGITSDQEKWLTWARAQAEAISPTGMRYPQLSQDGDFDRAAVTFGGPYPETKMLPIPPTMEQPQPRESTSYWHTPSQPEPYPFWLKYQR